MNSPYVVLTQTIKQSTATTGHIELLPCKYTTERKHMNGQAPTIHHELREWVGEWGTTIYMWQPSTADCCLDSGGGRRGWKKTAGVKSKLQSKVWESSMKSGGSQRREWQQMTKQAMEQRIGWNSFWSLVSWYFSRGSHSSRLVGL